MICSERGPLLFLPFSVSRLRRSNILHHITILFTCSPTIPVQLFLRTIWSHKPEALITFNFSLSPRFLLWWAPWTGPFSITPPLKSLISGSGRKWPPTAYYTTCNTTICYVQHSNDRALFLMSLLSFYHVQLGWNFNMLVSELAAVNWPKELTIYGPGPDIRPLKFWP